MDWNFLFVTNSVLLGVGLAMDAFSVSLANGLNEPAMRRGKMAWIAGTFGFFQALMPMAGWICVHTVVEYFQAARRFIPWIALALLLYIGGTMLTGALEKKEDGERERKALSPAVLLVQGVATSIDALSVGFTIADYNWQMALASALIIAAVTFVISLSGLILGRKFGVRLSGRAEILGGVILIAIGIEIFVRGIAG